MGKRLNTVPSDIPRKGVEEQRMAPLAEHYNKDTVGNDVQTNKDQPENEGRSLDGSRPGWKSDRNDTPNGAQEPNCPGQDLKPVSQNVKDEYIDHLSVIHFLQRDARNDNARRPQNRHPVREPG